MKNSIVCVVCHACGYTCCSHRPYYEPEQKTDHPDISSVFNVTIDAAQTFYSIPDGQAVTCDSPGRIYSDGKMIFVPDSTENTDQPVSGERCKHGVWAADRCEDCCKEQPDAPRTENRTGAPEMGAAHTTRNGESMGYEETDRAAVRPDQPVGLSQTQFMALMVKAGYNAAEVHPKAYADFSWSTLHGLLQNAPVRESVTPAKASITGEMVRRGAIACSQWRNGKKMPVSTWNGLPIVEQEAYADQALSCLVAALCEIEEQGRRR